MFKRLLSRLTAASSNPAARTRPAVSDRRERPAVESLEGRTLLHNPFVTAVSADNRGEVFITLDPDAGELSPSTFNKNSVQMYEAGPDGHLGNADDVRVPASIRFTQGNQRLLVRGPVTAGNGYRVKIVSSRITGLAAGFGFDGEFNGTFPSGNGVAGGNFEFQVKNDKSSTPTVRMSTSEGIINLRMRADVAPKSVKNFMSYANAGLYDNIFFTRNVPGFIIQGGSLQITGDGLDAGDIVETATFAPVKNEFNISNTRGTLAFAKSSAGADPVNSATNQFFLNLADNSSNLDSQNGGFTVFAQVRDNNSLAVMDAIAGNPVVSLHNSLTGHGVVPETSATGLDDTPVNSTAGLTGTNETTQSGDRLVVTGGLNPSRDLIIVRRVAMLSKVAKL